jgi:nucleotide-binding universal stress UspA family protein
MYKRILLAYDGSRCSDKALDEAIALATTQSATLCIAHVDERGELHGGMDVQAYVDRVGKLKKLHAQSEKLLEEACARARAAGCRIEPQLINAPHQRPADVIADAARDWQADLVIVGTHGRRGFQRLLVGSVAEDLVRIATTSLLLVRDATADDTSAA